MFEDLTIRCRIDHFNKWDDYDFKVRFRLSKETVIEESCCNSSSKTIMNFTVLCHGELFNYSAGDCIGVSKSSACLIVRDVNLAIANLRKEYVRMPKNDFEIRQLQKDFYKIAKFPLVIGAIDCTHVKIQSPGGPNADYKIANFRHFNNAFKKIVTIVTVINIFQLILKQLIYILRNFVLKDFYFY
ncbi:hypothetical protein ACI65C_003088 [Semiaphis heraclei]